MALCHEWGIPHSEFLDWEPEDRAKALAYFMVKSEHCDLCGTAKYEWDENKRAYEPVEEFCMGCYLKSIFEEGQQYLPGTSVTLMKTGTVEHAQHMVKQRKAARHG
jgi:hypothetical protein